MELGKHMGGFLGGFWGRGRYGTVSNCTDPPLFEHLINGHIIFEILGHAHNRKKVPPPEAELDKIRGRASEILPKRA